MDFHRKSINPPRHLHTQAVFWEHELSKERVLCMRIEIERVTMTYPGGRRALKDVSLTLGSPCLVGLLGPNGAGKSTLMKLLTAGLMPTEGEIRVDGRPLGACEKNLKRRLGYLPQSFGLYDELSVGQFLDYMCALKGLSDSREAVGRALRETNLEALGRVKIRALSGGQRQRVGIAQALLGSPEFLIFDEPTVGLDPEERIHFRNLFSQAAQERIVLLSTHIIEDVQSVCTQLVVIHEGNILFVGTPSELIRMAEGHVGVFEEAGAGVSGDFHVASRVNTARGVSCRVVAEVLPPFAEAVEPHLEDAYLYLIHLGHREAA